MNATDIVNRLKGHKGQHVLVTWTRPAKVRKDADGVVVTKRTSAYVRAGIAYSNLSSVKDAVASGEREESKGLPWGAWSAWPFIIAHKGREYLRLYPAVFDNLRPKVEWTIDGRPATWSEVEPLVLASEKPKETDEKPECFTVGADSIVAVGA